MRLRKILKTCTLPFWIKGRNLRSFVVWSISGSTQIIERIFRSWYYVIRKVLAGYAWHFPVDAEGVTALQIDDQWLLRQSIYQAVSIRQAWLPMFLNSDWLEE